MKAVVAAFNQEKALVGAFSVITNLRMELFQALLRILTTLAQMGNIAPKKQTKAQTVQEISWWPLIMFSTML